MSSAFFTRSFGHAIRFRYIEFAIKSTPVISIAFIAYVILDSWRI